MDEDENKQAGDEAAEERLGPMAALFGGAALFTIFVANVGVLARYVFRYSIPSVEEILRLVFVWLIFICSAFAYREGGLIAITMAGDALRKHPGWRKALFVFQHLAVLVFSLAMVRACWEMMVMQFEFEELSVVMEFNMGWMTMGAFIGFVLMALYACWHTLRNLLNPDGPISMRIRRSFRGFYPEG